MKKKSLLRCLLMLLLALLLPACAAPSNTEAGKTIPDEIEQEQSGTFLLGVITAEEPYSVSGRFLERFLEEQEESGSVQLLHKTWPADFLNQTEQNRQIIQDLVDQGVQGLIILDAFSGLVEILEEELADWAGFLAVNHPGDPLPRTAALADLVLVLDEERMGCHLVEKAYDMGADTFVYYTIPRYTQSDAPEEILLQAAQIVQTCSRLEMTLLPVLVPDEEAVLFIREDVPEKVAQYGHNTAFFSPVVVIQETAAQLVLETGAICPLVDSFAPFATAPSILGFPIEDAHYGEYDWLNQQIQASLADATGTARLAGFPVDGYTDLPLRTMLAYGEEWLAGERPQDYADQAALRRIMEGFTGNPCILRYYESDGVTYENCVLYSMEPVKWTSARVGEKEGESRLESLNQ